MSEHLKSWLDCASIGTIFLAFMDAMPHLAAAASVVWAFMRIYESYQHIKINQKKLGE